MSKWSQILLVKQSRRQFLKSAVVATGKLLLAETFLSGFYGCGKSLKPQNKKQVAYRIDAEKCVACGLCAPACARILRLPAIQAVNDLELCGFCRRCVAYFVEPENDSEELANLVCKFRALVRRYISEFRYEYTVDYERCKGCGACVRACRDDGQASLSLQINKNICLQCDTCLAQKACPYGAFIKSEKKLG